MDALTTNKQNKKLKFLQIHTFYTSYLQQFYENNPILKYLSFSSQIGALIADGFSGIHIFPPYMRNLNYETQFIVANNYYSQQQWVKENNYPSINPRDTKIFFTTIKYQIEKFQPDILYLGDPVLFDSKFIRTLTWKPSLIIGWRAANISETPDWSEFDIIFSCLSKLREVALNLGAKHTEHFFPGFPSHIYKIVKDISPKYDVGFTGTWTLNQHPRRNYLLNHIAKNATTILHQYSCGFYLTGQLDKLTPETAKYNLGSKFGLAMYRSLRSAKIIFDARGIIEIKNFDGKSKLDLAANETANMRIFEATGCGTFLLTEHFDNLKQLFNIGKEIETFHDEKELIDKIRYYLVHPEQREAIARRGHERCLKEYSMTNRAKEFDRIIRKYLSQKNNPQHSFTKNNKVQTVIYKLSSNLAKAQPMKLNNSEFYDFCQNIQPYTMISEKRLFSLFILSRHICINDLPGNFVECGVAAGESSALIASVIKKYSKRKRFLYAFDSFEGMPETSSEDVKKKGTTAQSVGLGTGTCNVSKQCVLNICKQMDLGDIIIPVEGDFEKTLPQKRNEIGSIAFLHLNFDWYDFTKSILINLYDRIFPGGVLQVDDYGHCAGCKKAIHEFESQNNLIFDIKDIDGSGVWFFKK